MGLRITTWNGRDLYILAKITLLLTRFLQLMVYGERYRRPALQHRIFGLRFCALRTLAKESGLGTHLDTSHGGTNVRLR